VHLSLEWRHDIQPIDILHNSKKRETQHNDA
jgi:hypothetical protein